MVGMLIDDVLPAGFELEQLRFVARAAERLMVQLFSEDPAMSDEVVSRLQALAFVLGEWERECREAGG